MTQPLALVVAALTLPLSGCATSAPSGGRPNQPYSTYTRFMLQSPSGPNRTYQAARRVATRWPAARVEEWPEEHRVVVISQDERDSRDRAVIEVLPSGEVAVDWRTQVAGSHGEWLSTDCVSGSYAYAREQQLAEQVVLEVRRERSRFDGE